MELTPFFRLQTRVACVIDGKRINPPPFIVMAKKLFTFTSLPSELQAQTFIQAGIPYSRSDLSIRLAQAFPYPIIVTIGSSGDVNILRASDVSDAQVSAMAGSDYIRLVPTTTDKTTEFTVQTAGASAVTASTEEVDAYFTTAVVPKRSASVAASFVDNVADSSAMFIFSQKGNGRVIATLASDGAVSAATSGIEPVMSATLSAYTGSVGTPPAFGE